MFATLSQVLGAVAQSGSAPRSHRGGQGFKSPQLHREIAGQAACSIFVGRRGSHCGSQVVGFGYGWGFAPRLRRRRHLLRSPGRLPGQPSSMAAEGLPGRTAKTVEVNRDSLRPLLAVIGTVPLKELTVQDVRTALSKMAATHATRTLQKAHNCLTRALRHAEGQDLVRRNVSALVDTPRGLEGRPSQSLTLAEATALRRRRTPPSHRGGRARCPLGAEGAADLVRQHDELPGRAGGGDRPAGGACQLPDDGGHLPAGVAPGDHDRG